LEIDVADVTVAEIKDGQVRLQIGDQATGRAFGQNYSFWGIPGFYSVPAVPDDDAAAQVLFIWDDNTKHIIGGRDNRHTDLVGALEPGDFVIVSGKARIFGKAQDNLVTFFSESASGKSMICSLDGANEEFTIQVGKSYISVGPDSITLGAGGAAIELDADGIAIIGKYIGLTAPGGHVGAAGVGVPLPPAAPPTANVIFGSSGMTGAPSPGWVVGA
jgi:hypothetical protein